MKTSSTACAAFATIFTFAAFTAFAVFALVPYSAHAALCDDTYALQSATETLFTGTNPKSLARSAKTLKPDFSDATLLHPQMAYDILAGFEGSCVKAAKPARFLARAAAAPAFTLRTDNAYQVVLYDSNTVLEHTRFGLWFAFYKPADTLQMAVGRVKGEGTDFRAWYAYLTFEDSVRSPETGLWTAKGTRLRTAGPSDSAVLDSLLMKQTGYRDLVFDQNRRGHFQLQFIRVSLTNNPGNAIRPRASRAVGGTGTGTDTDQNARDFLVDGTAIKAENIQAPRVKRRYVVRSGP